MQVKGSWAESEQERENFYNQVYEQEEEIETLKSQIEKQKI